MTMYAGIGMERSENMTVTELLRKAGLTDGAVNKESKVTPASLSKILTAIGKLN